MNYKDQLSLVSASILSLASGLDEEVHELCANGEAGIHIYQRNLFYGVHEHLAKAFPGLVCHCGDHNFRALVQAFVKKNHAKSLSFMEFRRDFRGFVAASLPMHGDQLLEGLCALDAFAYEDRAGQLSVPAGLFHYWSQLRAGEGEVEFDIDLGATESVEKVFLHGESYLRLK